MSCTVIYEKSGKLRLRDFSASYPNDISSIDFYVALAAKTQTQVFLIMKDLTTGLHEVVELQENTNYLGQPVFRVPLTYSLRLNNVNVTFQLMILDVKNQTHFLSDVSDRVYISTENYEFHHQIAVAHKLGADVKTYYEAIIQALQKIVEKGENVE